MAVAIRAVLEQSACIEQTIKEGDFHSAIAATVIACADCADYGGNDFEPPALRDARCRLLATTIACHMVEVVAHDSLSNAGIKLLHGLLERRLLNWYSHGHAGQQHFIEKLFGEEIYDGGRDSASGQLTIADWVSSADISAEHEDWLAGKAKEVHAEKQRRIQDVLELEHFPIGLRVRITGLQKATRLNGQCGVITRKLGERRGVIFEEAFLGTKSVKVKNLTATVLVCVRGEEEGSEDDDSVLSSSAPPQASSKEILHLLRELVSWFETKRFDRPDIAARLSYLKDKLAKGETPAPRCGDMMVPRRQRDRHLKLIAKLQPPCVGTGEVDFFMMAGHTKGSAGREPARGLREWVVSGSCYACQRAIFGPAKCCA